MSGAAFRRVVVTGLGTINPLGLDVESTWKALTAGQSGVSLIEGIDSEGLDSRVAGQVKGFDPVLAFGKRRARHLDRFVQLALTATTEALEQSKLDIAAYPERVGVVYGTGIGGIDTLVEGAGTLAERGPEWVNPYSLPKLIPNMAAGEIAIAWGIKGYSSCPVTACSASAQAIGEAFDMIRLGRADAVVCGGSEAAVNRLSLAAFAAMKALSTRNDDPQGASRPFDKERDGFVMGEGAATLVLEARDSALARGANILGELRGYAATTDAYHITAPHPEAEGAIRAMTLALEDAGVRPAEVGYINAHGTSTPPNDRMETLAVKRVWGEKAPPMSSTKSMTGHTLGAAGALESIFCLQALSSGVLPPTINQQTPDPACDLDYIPNRARSAAIEVAVSNSFGFGGHNASLVWART